MNIRDLKFWPPNWRGPSGAGNVPEGEDGTLTGVRWVRKDQSIALTMEYDGARHSAVLHGEVGPLTTLYLLLGWHVGRALARIGSLEITR